jgi:hypothetical protein
MRRWLLSLAKAVLPDRFIEWYRRRRALHRYLRAMSYEVFHRQVRLDRSALDDLEDRVTARRDGFYQQMVKDVLERTDLVLQQLDRKIEGVSARQGRELRALHAEVKDLKATLGRLGHVGPGQPVSAAGQTPTEHVTAGDATHREVVPVGEPSVITPVER